MLVDTERERERALPSERPKGAALCCCQYDETWEIEGKGAVQDLHERQRQRKCLTVEVWSPMRRRHGVGKNGG